MENYFTGGWDIISLKLLAKFFNWQMGSKIDEYETDEKKLMQDIIDNGNMGDTEARLLYENSRVLVYLSLDSCIEVVSVIPKNNFAKAESIEL